MTRMTAWQAYNEAQRLEAWAAQIKRYHGPGDFADKLEAQAARLFEYAYAHRFD